MNAGRGLYAAAVTGLLAAFAFQLWLHATRTSATFDEPPHVLAGYRYWQCGDFAINPEHPPLLKRIATLPLLAENLPHSPPWPCGSRVTPKIDSFQAGNEFLAANGTDATLLPARLAAASLSVMLALLVFLAAREMFGDAAALVALALLAFEPNLVAHGSLVTTDMAVAALMFATVYAVYRYRKRPSAARLVLAGLAAGLTLASKFSGVVVVPALLVVDALLAGGATASSTTRTGLLARLAAPAAMLVIALAVVWASYGFQYRALPGGGERVLLVDAPAEAAVPPGPRLVRAAGEAGLVPESYAFGLASVLQTAGPMVLLGAVYPLGRWFYFPVAFTIKTSVALLALLALALATVPLWRERQRECATLLAPALLFFAVSLGSRLNIGIRHLLPVYPFFIVFAGAAAAYWMRQRKAALFAVLALLGYHAIATARTAPDYIAFGNAFWGGTTRTHRYLGDSNVEWGQNLVQVRDYLAREGVTQCWIVPFGNGAVVRAGQPCRLLPGSWDWDLKDPIEPVPADFDGTLLVSTANLPPGGGVDYETLETARPIALIGGSTFVYRGTFHLPLAAAANRIERANQFLAAHRPADAVAESRQAVALAPSSLRAHLVLGVALQRAGSDAEGRRELEIAGAIAATTPQLFTWDDATARDTLRRLQAGEPVEAEIY